MSLWSLQCVVCVMVCGLWWCHVAGVVWCGVVLFFCCPEPHFLSGIIHGRELCPCSPLRTSTLVAGSDNTLGKREQEVQEFSHPQLQREPTAGYMTSCLSEKSIHQIRQHSFQPRKPTHSVWSGLVWSVSTWDLKSWGRFSKAFFSFLYLPFGDRISLCSPAGFKSMVLLL